VWTPRTEITIDTCHGEAIQRPSRSSEIASGKRERTPSPNAGRALKLWTLPYGGVQRFSSSRVPSFHLRPFSGPRTELRWRPEFVIPTELVMPSEEGQAFVEDDNH
jgi:hypothetical protein